jgi:type II secretory pathway component PulM
MKMKLSAREKTLVIGAAFALIFLVFWYIFFNPLLARSDLARQEIKGLQARLEALKKAPLHKPVVPPKINVYNREEQTSRLMTFINKTLPPLEIRLVSLTQSAEKNIITIDLQAIASYHQLLGLLNSLYRAETLLVIDKLNVAQQGDKLNIFLRLKSGHL